MREDEVHVKSRKILVLVLCGMVTGVLFYVLTGLALALFAERALSVLATAPTQPRLSGSFFLTVDVLMGTWVMWLYTVLAGRHRAGMKTALVAGFAWWAMKTLQSANWVGLGFVPLQFVPVPLATSLVCAVVATGVGAALYDSAQRNQTASPVVPDAG